VLAHPDIVNQPLLRQYFQFLLDSGKGSVQYTFELGLNIERMIRAEPHGALATNFDDWLDFTFSPGELAMMMRAVPPPPLVNGGDVFDPLEDDFMAPSHAVNGNVFDPLDPAYTGDISGVIGPAGVLQRAPALLPVLGMAVARGVTSFRMSRLGRILFGAEVLDLLTPDIDLPSPSDIPQVALELAKTLFIDIPGVLLSPGALRGGGSFPGGIDGQWAMAQHGSVVREWDANGVPFVQFMDGYLAAQKKNGSWKFWKPKKPVVYVPGGPMSRRQASRMATLYQAERKRVKKTFDLVDRKSPGPKKGTTDVHLDVSPAHH